MQVAKPQNARGVASRDTYCGRAPIFITTSISDIAALHAAGDGDASMLLRRLMVVTFAARVVILAQDLPVCAACFARFALAYSWVGVPPISVCSGVEEYRSVAQSPLQKTEQPPS